MKKALDILLNDYDLKNHVERISIMAKFCSPLILESDEKIIKETMKFYILTLIRDDSMNEDDVETVVEDMIDLFADEVLKNVEIDINKEPSEKEKLIAAAAMAETMYN